MPRLRRPPADDHDPSRPREEPVRENWEDFTPPPTTVIIPTVFRVTSAQPRVRDPLGGKKVDGVDDPNRERREAVSCLRLLERALDDVRATVKLGRLNAEVMLDVSDAASALQRALNKIKEGGS